MPEQDALFDDPAPDLHQMVAELERELVMRRRVYPRLVDQGKLAQATADYRIDVLNRVIVTLTSGPPYGPNGA